MIDFKVQKQSKKSRARIGILKTLHGEVETPTLVPVATQAVVKAMTVPEVEATHSQILICNTFHLHLKPGEGIVKKNGGLHQFMNWPHPLMTDSGGFQVFSLGFGRDHNVGKIVKNTHVSAVTKGAQPKALKITDHGVWFRSPVDGKKVFIGPKESITIQGALGADIIFAFDECTPPNADHAYTAHSLQKTHQWAQESLNALNALKPKSYRLRPALYGIVQGGKFKDLRKTSAQTIGAMSFDGFGIGGEFGANKKTMTEMLDVVIPELPDTKPRHLLGIGHPEDIIPIIKAGVDTFDCIVPTHYARHGTAFISPPKRGSGRDFVSVARIDLNKSLFLKDLKPLDPKCACDTCTHYTRSYIAHLLRAKEITALRLLTFHNLYFFNTWIARIREDVKRGKL